MEFNSLDFLLMFFLVLGALWGLLRGAGRLLIGLFSLYVGLVISLLLYEPLGRFFRNLLPAMSVNGSRSLAFVVLLFAFVNGLSFLTRYLSTPPEERKRRQTGEFQQAVAKGGQRFLIGPLNQLFGLMLGLFLTIVWMSLILAVLQLVTRSGLPTAGGALVAFRRQLDASQLIPWFNDALVYIYWAVSIWVPGREIPSIFAGLLGQS